MEFTKLLKQAEHMVAENSSAILTGVGIVGVVTTAVLAGRAGFKAEEIIETKRDEILRKPDEDLPSFTTMDKAKMVWPEFVPAVGAGITTVTAIFFSHQLAMKKTAALAAAYGISEKAFQEYKDKVVEKLGNNKETKIRDEIAQERVSTNPPDATIIVMGNDVLFHDALIGRYFSSTMEKVQQAVNKTNQEIIDHSYASLAFFYDLLDLPGSDFADQVGWNTENILEVQYSTTLTPDNRPCISISFRVQPFPEYEKSLY